MNALFENENYRVIHTPSQKPSKVTFICFDHWRSAFDVERPREYSAPFAQSEILNLGYNYVGVQSRRNDWYQLDGILEALNEVAHLKRADDIFINYGGSMGGFAAINFYSLIGADFFIALAPQASLKSEFMDQIKDKRWDRASKIFRHNFILTGYNNKARGIVIHDPTQLDDEKHVSAILQKIQVNTIEAYGGGHFPGKIINATYGIKRILKLLPDVFTAPDSLSSLVNEINQSAREHYQARFALGDTEKRVEMIAYHGAQKFTEHAIDIMLQDFSSTHKNVNALALAIHNCAKEDHTETRHRASFALAKAGFIRLAGDLEKDGQLFGFGEHASLEAILKEKEFIGADNFRDEAIRLDHEGNLEKARTLMQIARELRPSGAYIQEKLNEYESRLNL